MLDSCLASIIRTVHSRAITGVCSHNFKVDNTILIFLTMILVAMLFVWFRLFEVVGCTIACLTAVADIKIDSHTTEIRSGLPYVTFLVAVLRYSQDTIVHRGGNN